VLEHCDDPAQAVRELRRVTAPGGRVLASTHGTQVYHPSPHDLWRWTHAGLERLFAQNAEWSALRVIPGAGTTACLGMLVATYLDIAFQRAHVRPLGYPLVAAINAVAEAIDRRVPSLREPIAGSLIPNFHVVAEVAP
jgi:SAM-dependent methyltransferase